MQKFQKTPEVCQNCGAKDPYRPLLSLDPGLDNIRKCQKCGHEILLQPEPSCEFYRSTPEENRCMEGDCYYGNTEETRAFGNCCFFCPKKATCEGRCSFIDEQTQGDH